jgi:hypothetical protein
MIRSPFPAIFLLKCAILFCWRRLFAFQFFWPCLVLHLAEVGRPPRLTKRHWNNLIKRIWYNEGRPQNPRRARWKAAFKIPFKAKKIIMMRLTAAHNGGPQQVLSPSYWHEIQEERLWVEFRNRCSTLYKQSHVSCVPYRVYQVLFTSERLRQLSGTGRTDCSGSRWLVDFKGLCKWVQE